MLFCVGGRWSLLYPVSEAFLQAVQENTRRYYWTGKITTTKGATYEFGADDIVKGSDATGDVAWFNNAQHNAQHPVNFNINLQ